jgi:ribonuclease D
MNEKIKQLAEQAGLRFTQLMSNPMVPVVDGKETDLEKFAELIVKECIDTAFHKGHPDLEFLLKHFGVEE